MGNNHGESTADSRLLQAQEAAVEDHKCNKGAVLEILVGGQEKIFNKLDDMTAVLQNVAVQQNEINHIKEDVAGLKEHNAKQDARIDALEKDRQPQEPQKEPLWIQVRNAVIITLSVLTATFIFGLTAYIGLKNLPGYVDFQRSQINGEPVAKAR